MLVCNSMFTEWLILDCAISCSSAVASPFEISNILCNSINSKKIMCLQQRENCFHLQFLPTAARYCTILSQFCTSQLHKVVGVHIRGEVNNFIPHLKKPVLKLCDKFDGI